MKEKINYKLVNILLCALIIYVVYLTKDLWLGIFHVCGEILIPFLIAFAIAYALNPIVSYLQSKKISKGLAITIVLLAFALVFGLLLYLIVPVFMEQVGSIFNGIIAFFKELSFKYNVDFYDVQSKLSQTFNATLTTLGTYISNGAISVIGVSLSIISKILIIFAALIYFMNDMDKIKEFVKNFLLKRNKKMYNYVATVDQELENYLSGFIKIVFISFFEYTILYLIIDHPDALMLGTLAAVGNLVPYFGGIFTNIIAAVTAFVISPVLFLKTCIVFVIFSAVDGYVINPLVYGKTNQVHPLVVIISVFAGGILFGIPGIIIALPTAIVLIATYKFFKDDINEYSEKKIKEYKKEKLASSKK